MANYPAIPHIRDGEPVDASTAGRPDRLLESRINEINARLETTEAGRALVSYNVPMSAESVPGSPMYFNSQAGVYSPALASAAASAETASIVPDETCDVIGLVLRKHTPNTGDMLLLGAAALETLPAGVTTPGRYYLSSASPGSVTKQRPPVSIALLYYDGTEVHFSPHLDDFLEDHIHFRVDLVMQVAGTNNGVSITSTDTAQQGWIPASNAVFEGKAPAGAQYGYNIAAHQTLADVFPPVPTNAASAFWNQGSRGSRVEATEEIIVIDRDGIWWMSVESDELPWDTDLTDVAPAVRLYFLRMTYMTERAVVTAIKPAEGSPITVTDCDGETASTGKVLLDVNLNLLQQGTEEPGNLAVKRLDDGKLLRGPVVIGLTGGNGIEVTEDGGTPGVFHVAVQEASSGEEIEPTVAWVDDTEQRFYRGIPYIAFIPGRKSGVAYRYHVPVLELADLESMRMRVLLLARTSGSLPTLSASILRLPRGTGAQTIPSTPTPVTITGLPVSVGANTYIELESQDFSVSPGDTIILYLERAAGDGYSGEVGLVRTSLEATSQQES